MTDEAAEVVPRGERADLQRTAQETGERFGRQDEAINTVIALFIAIAGFVLTVVLALIAMYANGQIQL